MAFYTQKITSWAFSRWSAWEECGFKAKCKFVLKLKEPGNAAMDRGSAIHTEAEDYVKGAEKRLSPNLVNFKDDFVYLRKYGATAETNYTFRKDWTQTVWDDWDGAWCRVKLDSRLEHEGNETTVNDYKTGKVKDAPLQMELYAVAEFAAHPEVERVHTALWYLDHAKGAGNPIEISFDRASYDALRKGWEKRVAPMLADTTFKPKPGNHCRWCHFRKDNGGPCVY